MQSRFHRDFSHVRVHNDARAAQSAAAVNAAAYAVGAHIVFGEAQYSPETAQGPRLIAHELTHTIQQDGVGYSADQPIHVGDSSSASEIEAERASR